MDENVPRKQRKPKHLRLLIFLLLCLLLGGILSNEVYTQYQTYDAEYHSLLSLAETGAHQLLSASTSLKTLQTNPFDTHSLSDAQRDFASASSAFNRVNNSLLSLPSIVSSIPNYGSRLQSALRLLPVAIEVSQLGGKACGILSMLITHLRNPVSSQHGGLTMADYAAVNMTFQQVVTTFKLITTQVDHLQPADLQLDPRLTSMVALFHKDLPEVQSYMGLAQSLLPALPLLLGVGTPTNFLVEILDSTELRPGGGFIGNYGVLTLSNGLLASAHMTDTYLLDRPYEASGKVTPYPPAYTWFDLAPETWTLRDSNLDADFPTAAHYAELLYQREGGTVHFQGVIAITPPFIEHILAITGPISVPEYHKTVTASNLVDLIHYYQVGPGDVGGDAPSSDGHSSVRKRFTELLSEQLIARIHQIAQADLKQLSQLFISSLHAKDVQIFFNSSTLEGALHQFHIDSTIQSPAGDSLFVVDANISPSKANQYIKNTLNDQITIDASGNAIHHTTITYAWTEAGNVFGSPIYRDYLRIYAPPDSILHHQSGWGIRGTGHAFGREMWAGFFTLTFGHTRTITLDWTVPHAVQISANGWNYQYLIQRQAGAQWLVHLNVTIRTCVTVKSAWTGGLQATSMQTASLTQSLSGDLHMNVNYMCRAGNTT